MNKPAPPASIIEHAEFIDGIIARCTMRSGGVAGVSDLSITADDAKVLKDISTRLWLMGPFEAQIRKTVTGR